jgi:TolA-binding protein
MKTILLLLLLIIPAGLAAQTAEISLEEERLVLDKMADDLRYDNAYQFYRLARYDQAVRLFEEYLEVYTDGSHRIDAYNYSARIYFQNYDYRKALKAYLSLYEEYSEMEEGLSAYYNAGVCYLKMGMKREAANIFKRISDEHPASMSARNARVQLDVEDIVK